MRRGIESIFSSLFLFFMTFTKAQKEILNTLENGEEVLNYQQRMKAIRPLIEMGIVYIQEIKDKNGITDSVKVCLVD